MVMIRLRPRAPKVGGMRPNDDRHPLTWEVHCVFLSFLYVSFQCCLVLKSALRYPMSREPRSDDHVQDLSSTSSHSPLALGEPSSLPLPPVVVGAVEASTVAGSSSSSSSMLARLPVGADAPPAWPAETSSEVSSIRRAKMGAGTVFW
jgi:hypothetical protein